MIVRIKKNDWSSLQLIRAFHNDAGLDIVAAEGKEIPPGKAETFSTRLHIAIPDGHVGIVTGRSGLWIKHDIQVPIGTIDAGFRGEVLVKLMNHGEKPYTVQAGDRIAQMIIFPVIYCPITEEMRLPRSDRGTGGYGHTGR